MGPVCASAGPARDTLHTTTVQIAKRNVFISPPLARRRRRRGSVASSGPFHFRPTQPFPTLLVPTATPLFHDARLRASALVQVQDDLPDLVLVQEVLPHRHGRVPRC